MNRKNFLGMIFIGLILPACSMQKLALRSAAGIFEKGVSAFYEEPDTEFARSAMASQLKQLEVFIKSDPKNPVLLTRAAQGFGAYAFLFLEDEEPARAKRLYRRGRDYGFRAVQALGGKKIQTISDMKEFSHALETFSKNDLDALFWTAYAWGGLANLSRSDPEALSDLPRIEKVMTYVSQKSPGFFYGGPEIFLGAYYGSRPKMFGGDLEKSKEFFSRAFDASKRKFLMTQVLYARHYCIPAQDRETFESSLKEVLTAPEDILQAQTLSNMAAKDKARKLLADINDYF